MGDALVEGRERASPASGLLQDGGGFWQLCRTCRSAAMVTLGPPRGQGVPGRPVGKALRRFACWWAHHGPGRHWRDPALAQAVLATCHGISPDTRRALSGGARPAVACGQSGVGARGAEGVGRPPHGGAPGGRRGASSAGRRGAGAGREGGRRSQDGSRRAGAGVVERRRARPQSPSGEEQSLCCVVRERQTGVRLTTEGGPRRSGHGGGAAWAPPRPVRRSRPVIPALDSVLQRPLDVVGHDADAVHGGA